MCCLFTSSAYNLFLTWRQDKTGIHCHTDGFLSSFLCIKCWGYKQGDLGSLHCSPMDFRKITLGMSIYMSKRVKTYKPSPLPLGPLYAEKGKQKKSPKQRLAALLESRSTFPFDITFQAQFCNITFVFFQPQPVILLQNHSCLPNRKQTNKQKTYEVLR